MALSSNFKLNITLNAIRDLIPNVHLRDIEDRTRRSLLPFVGKLFGSLFGTSTEDEVRQLAAHVKGVAENQMKIVKNFQTYSDHMSSFISSTNQRIDVVIEAMKSQRQEYNAFISSVQGGFRVFQTILYHSNTALYQSFTLQTELDNLLNAVELLATGKLPSYLVPAKLLSDTIHSIQQELVQRFNGFEIVHFSPSYYYTHAKILTVRTGRSLIHHSTIPNQHPQIVF